MTRAEFGHWQFEHARVLRVIASVEAAERASLKQIGYPVEPAAIEAVLRSSTGTAASRRRAARAMKTLALLAQCRGHVGLTTSNPRLAAHDALLAGLFAGDAARAGVVHEHAAKAARVKAAKARRRSKAPAWAREVAERRAGTTKAAAIAHIERREGRRPGTVKKAIARLRK